MVLILNIQGRKILYDMFGKWSSLILVLDSEFKTDLEGGLICGAGGWFEVLSHSCMTKLEAYTML